MPLARPALLPHSVTSTRSHPDASSRLGLSACRALSGPENRALRRARIGSDGCRRVVFDQAVLVAGVAQELSLRHPQARRIGGDWQRSSSVLRNIGAQVGAALCDADCCALEETQLLYRIEPTPFQLTHAQDSQKKKNVRSTPWSGRHSGRGERVSGTYTPSGSTARAVIVRRPHHACALRQAQRCSRRLERATPQLLRAVQSSSSMSP